MEPASRSELRRRCSTRSLRQNLPARARALAFHSVMTSLSSNIPVRLRSIRSRVSSPNLGLFSRAVLQLSLNRERAREIFSSSWSTTNPTSSCYFASTFGGISAKSDFRWSSPNPSTWRLSASRATSDRALILILSDINMPGMSGLELLSKAKVLRPDVPIIMITAYGDAETKREALENGAEALLTKPLDFAVLRERNR